MYDIITLGSGTVDVFVKTQNPEIQKHQGHNDVCYAIGQKILVKDLHVDTGGGGTNTAVAFARLGLKTSWIGAVGNDLHAKTLLDEMKREHVHFLGTRKKGMTGYSVILTGLEQNRTILAFKGVNDQLASKDVPWNKLNTKWLYLSAMMGKSFETLKRAAAFARNNKIRFAFNPSMYLAQQGLQALKQIIDGCDLLVLNKEEAQALLNTNKRCVDMLPLLQKHAKIVVITDGPKTAYASNGIHQYAIEPPNIPVVETTGAGDAFAAGMLAGLIIKKDIAEALQWAMKNSCAVIQHLGAKNKLLSRKEIERWTTYPARISITRL